MSSQAGYEPLLLSSSIEYWDTALTFVRLEFVAERILELEYFVGRAPFSNAVIQFQYDEEDKNFYVYRTYYREDKCFLIGNEHNHGKRIWSSILPIQATLRMPGNIPKIFCWKMEILFPIIPVTFCMNAPIQ